MKNTNLKKLEKELAAERRAIQKLIRDSEMNLYRKIKKEHREFIKRMGTFCDTEPGHLIDPTYYEGIERDIINRIFVEKNLEKYGTVEQDNA